MYASRWRKHYVLSNEQVSIKFDLQITNDSKGFFNLISVSRMQYKQAKDLGARDFKRLFGDPYIFNQMVNVKQQPPILKNPSDCPKNKPITRQLSRVERCYNRRLAQQRVIVEHIQRHLKIFNFQRGFIPTKFSIQMRNAMF